MTEELDARYTAAVQEERAAWHDLQAQPPGTPARAEAWIHWSEAISKTNAAWRRLNGAQHAPQQPSLDAQPQRAA